MMTPTTTSSVNPYSSANTASAPTAAADTSAPKSSWGSLGANDFISLLTAQLNNQDPTAPVDNTQMVAQLAQFSSLSNLSDIKDSLKTTTQQAESLSAIATKLDTLNSTVTQLLAQQPANTPA